MVKEVDILNYLPPILREVKELQRVVELENWSLEEMWRKLEQVLDNQFILYADEEGLARYERMLNISPGGTETLETRRFRLLATYQEQAPYSIRVVRRLLDNLLGVGNYEFTRNAAEKWVRVKLQTSDKRQYEIVEILLERVTPQNMVLDIVLRLNEYIVFYKWPYRVLEDITYETLLTHELSFTGKTNAELAAFTNEQLAAQTHEEIEGVLIVGDKL